MSDPKGEEPDGKDPVEIEWQFDALDLRPVERWLATLPTLAIETGHFGIKVSVMQPGAVSSGGGERAKVFLTENDPYAPLYEALGVLRGESVTPQDVAAAVADTIEQPSPPLRVPVGVPAKRALQARKEAPETEPFLLAEINW